MGGRNEKRFNPVGTLHTVSRFFKKRDGGSERVPTTGKMKYLRELIYIYTYIIINALNLKKIWRAKKNF